MSPSHLVKSDHCGVGATRSWISLFLLPCISQTIRASAQVSICRETGGVHGHMHAGKARSRHGLDTARPPGHKLYSMWHVQITGCGSSSLFYSTTAFRPCPDIYSLSRLRITYNTITMELILIIFITIFGHLYFACLIITVCAKHNLEIWSKNIYFLLGKILVRVLLKYQTDMKYW